MHDTQKADNPTVNIWLHCMSLYLNIVKPHTCHKWMFQMKPFIVIIKLWREFQKSGLTACHHTSSCRSSTPCRDQYGRPTIVFWEINKKTFSATYRIINVEISYPFSSVGYPQFIGKTGFTHAVQKAWRHIAMYIYCNIILMVCIFRIQ